MRIKTGVQPGRFVIALLAGAAAFGASLTAASALPGLRSDLGLGASAARSCSTGHVGIGYRTAFTPGSGYTVGAVTITGLDSAACAGRTAQVTLSGGSGAPLTHGSALLPVPGRAAPAALTVPLTGVVPLADIARSDIAVG
jgi:hypothetical protein